jgi:RNA polymerase sigma factor (sigma-70 family)
VRDAQRGAPGALDALLAGLRPAFVTFFARHLDLDDAEDLAQQALIRITHALPQIDPARAGRYVTRVAWNLLRSEYERTEQETDRRVSAELADTVESRFTSDLDVELGDLDADRPAILDTLPPSLRAIVHGRLRGLRSPEIAAAQQIDPVTVRTRLLRARARLRRHFGLDGDGSPRDQ